MPSKVNILKRENLIKDFFSVEKATLRFERYDGEMSNKVERICAERGDAAAALLYHIEKKAFILIEQFRYPAYQRNMGWLVETVAGGIEDGEQPEDSIKREIEEEVGFSVSSIEKIATFFTSPGGTSEQIFLFFAKVSEAGRINEGGGAAEENEDIKLVYLPNEELLEQLDKNEIKDAKTLIALQYIALKGTINL